MKITYVEIRNIATLSKKHMVEWWFIHGMSRRLQNMGFYPSNFNLTEYQEYFQFRTGGWIQALSPHLEGFDQEVVWYTGETSVEDILDDSPRIILLSITETVGYPIAQKFVQACRKSFPQHAIWIGGLFASTCPDTVEKELKPDMLFIGEADSDIRSLVTAYLGGDEVPPRIIVKHCPQNDLLQDWALFLKYSSQLNRRVPLVLTSRDCVYDCAFCSILKKGAMREYNLGKLESSLSRLLDQNGEVKIYIESPLPLASEKWSNDLSLLFNNLHVTWYCDSRVLPPNSKTQLLFENLYASGCRDIYLGTETFDQDIHDRMGKGIRVENIVPFAKQARKAGINVQTGWIMGFPGQTAKSVRHDVDLVVENLATDVFSVADYTYLTIFPGTRLYQDPEKFGIELVDWNPDNITLRPCHNTTELSKDQIWDLYLEGLEKVGKTQNF